MASHCVRALPTRVILQVSLGKQVREDFIEDISAAMLPASRATSRECNSWFCP